MRPAPWIGHSGNVVSRVLRVSEEKPETTRTGEACCDGAITVRVGD